MAPPLVSTSTAVAMACTAIQLIVILRDSEGSDTQNRGPGWSRGHEMRKISIDFADRTLVPDRAGLDRLHVEDLVRFNLLHARDELLRFLARCEETALIEAAGAKGVTPPKDFPHVPVAEAEVPTDPLRPCSVVFCSLVCHSSATLPAPIPATY